MTKYSNELKMKIVKEYYSGKYSFNDLAVKYNIETSTTIQKYSEDFKINIIKLYQKEHRSRVSLTREYGVHPTTVGDWIRDNEKVRLEDGTSSTVKELKQVQKENEELRKENEILKAAAVLLGKH